MQFAMKSLAQETGARLERADDLRRERAPLAVTEHEDAISHSHDAPDSVHGDDAHGHDDHGHGHAHTPHESPWVVTVPLILLAIPSIVIGWPPMLA